MMKKLPPSLITLVIGLLLGFLISRGSSGSGDGKGSNGGDTSGDASNIPRRPNSPSSSGGKNAKKTNRRAGSVGLQTLMNLTDAHHGAQPSREFYEALDALETSDISLLIAELNDIPNGDPRTNKLRNALYDLWAKHNPEEAWSAAIMEKNTNIRGQAITAVMGEIARNDITRAQDMLDDIEDPQTKQSALYAIINNASIDHPEVVFDLLTHKNLKSNQSHLFHSLFYNWARENPDAAIGKLDEIKNPQDKNRAYSAIATALASIDPERAVEFAMGLESAANRNMVLGNVAAGIVNDDPQKALKLLDDITNRQARASILSSIASNWLRTDPDAAIAWIDTLAPNEKSRVMENGMWQFIHNNVEKAAELISSLPTGNQSSHFYSSIAGQWAQRDPDAALKWAEALPPGRGRSQAMNGVLSAVAAQDPQLAASYYEKEGSSQNSSSQIGSIVANWAKTDQAAALTWMNSLDLKGDTRRNAITNAVSQWAHQDGEGAAAFVLSLENTKDQSQAISSLMGGWASNDPDTALTWAETNLDGDMRNKALGSLIQNVTHSDYLTAVEMFDEATAGLPSETIEKNFANVTNQIVSTWSQHDPQGASEWLMGLPEGDQRTRSVRSMVDNWGNYDVDGAAEFVLTLNEGNERDGAIQSLVRDVQRSDPEAAFLWAESVGDENKRTDLIRQSARSWNEADPDAAHAAIMAADLSDKSRKSILQTLGY